MFAMTTETATMLVMLALVTGVLLIGMIPGYIAKKNNHPYKTAISYLGVIGIVFFGIGWIAALIWALSLKRDSTHAPKTTRKEKTLAEYQKWKAANR